MLRFLDRLDQAMITGELDLTRLSVPKARILVKKGNPEVRTKDKYRPTIECEPAFDFNFALPTRMTLGSRYKVIPEVPVFLQEFRFPYFPTPLTIPRLLIYVTSCSFRQNVLRHPVQRQRSCLTLCWSQAWLVYRNGSLDTFIDYKFESCW